MSKHAHTTALQQLEADLTRSAELAAAVKDANPKTARRELRRLKHLARGIDATPQRKGPVAKIRGNPVLVAVLTPVAGWLTATYGFDVDPEQAALLAGPALVALAAWARAQVRPIGGR